MKTSKVQILSPPSIDLSKKKRRKVFIFEFLCNDFVVVVVTTLTMTMVVVVV
jgi:hypothetical protein